MHPQHVIAFCNHKIVRYTERANFSRKLYDEHKAKMESKLLYRIFNWKWLPDLWDDWDFMWCERWIVEMRETIAKAEYSHKMGYKNVKFEFLSGSLQTQFYEYCAANNLPY